MFMFILFWLCRCIILMGFISDNNHQSPESASRKQNTFHEISLVGQQSSQDSSYVQDTLLQYDVSKQHFFAFF